MSLTNEQFDTVKERVMALIPEAEDDSMLAQIIDGSGAFAEAFTNRTSIPDGMLGAVGDLAIIAYNRRGTEGESARTEGGATFTFETAPESVYNILKMYRLARVGGVAHEAETE